jgi:Flp pilus assembly protein TadG
MNRKPKQKTRKRRERGQGLIEFAMVLPVLLLTIMGIIDFGRLFVVYSNLFNAAREGTRYGIVNPKDVPGIANAARNKVDIVEPANVDIYVEFDSGPGTAAKSFEAVTIGDRVIVTVNHDVEMITPLVRVIAQELHLETVAARTISTMGEIGAGGGSAAPPTSTPDGTTTPSVTPTVATLDTATPTPTFTPAPTFTPTPEPGVAPIEIDTPLFNGDMIVTGSAEPGETVYLRDIQDPNLNLATQVGSDGIFRFSLPIGLVSGHVIAVQGYGYIDYAIVEGSITPTATPTPTASPTPTPTPSGAFIDLDPTCGPGGNGTKIFIDGHQWPVNRGDFDIYFDGTWIKTITARSDFHTDIIVDAADGTHTVMVETSKKNNKHSDSKTYVVPCPITPTPTPSYPNLVIESVALENTGTLSSYEPLTFTVSVRNIGAAAVNNLFWVDLYVDPVIEPPTASSLAEEGSVAWAAVSSLAQNETISLTLEYLDGISTVGDHTAYALADTWQQVVESNEEDNVGGPLAITIAQAGTPPTPTPTPDSGGETPGAISGSTWLLINADAVPQGRVDVYLDNGVEVIAETLSDQDGNYLFENVPPGTYTVIGETVIDGQLYTGYESNVVVQSGQLTEYVTLVLISSTN